MLIIKNLIVRIEDKKILNGFNLEVKAGEIHALMGPNGAGKSTLAKVLAGDPSYEVLSGEIWFKGQNILEMQPEERAKLGLFMGFQYPVEIPGVSNMQFLHAAYNAIHSPITEEAFEDKLKEKMALMEMREEFKERSVNEGFSGGEKKRNEILQMAVLEPSLAILDETDSGLDIDAIRIVANGVSKLRSPQNALILITHYQRLLEYIEPHFVHVVVEGRIVQSGGSELAFDLEEKGYQCLLT